MSALLIINTKLNKTEVIYSKSPKITQFNLDSEGIHSASLLCSQELVEVFRKMFLKATFNPKMIQENTSAQKKIRKILLQELTIAQCMLGSKNFNQFCSKIQTITNMSATESNYIWLVKAFEASEKIHSLVIENG